MVFRQKSKNVKYFENCHFSWIFYVHFLRGEKEFNHRGHRETRRKSQVKQWK